MLRTTGVDGVSIARGAIGNPWIFAQVRSLLRGEALPPPPSVVEQRDVLCEHFALSQLTYGPERCVTMMCKFGVKYARLHPDHQQVRNQFAIARTTADWRRVLAHHYRVDRPGCFPQVDDTAHKNGNSASSAADL